MLMGRGLVESAIFGNQFRILNRSCYVFLKTCGDTLTLKDNGGYSGQKHPPWERGVALISYFPKI